MMTIVDIEKELEAEYKVLMAEYDKSCLAPGQRGAIVKDMCNLVERMTEITEILEFAKTLERQFAKEEI